METTITTSVPSLQNTENIQCNLEEAYVQIQGLRKSVQRGQETLFTETIELRSKTVSNQSSLGDLQNTTKNFQAGKTRNYLEHWKALTSDTWILETVTGYYVELSRTPIQFKIPNPIKFNQDEHCRIKEELERFVNCNIIEKVSNYIPGEFISNIFVRPKKENKIRIILNLKQFNEHIDLLHFKMETLQSAIHAMHRNFYFGSVDLSESYYSVPIAEEHHKYFRFWFDNQKYQFTCLVMGLATAPRVTKILKPIFAFLRERGYISTAYIDDSCLQGETYSECKDNIAQTIKLMDSLGLTINPDKSVLIPSKQIVFVGFILCSETMTIKPTSEKIQKIRESCVTIYQSKFIVIRTFAQLIGMLVACEPGVRYAPLYYKPLEKIKEHNLNRKRGNFNVFMRVTEELKFHLQWWMDNLDQAFQVVAENNPDLVMTCDSSMTGWGAEIASEQKFTKGVWSAREQTLHINVLELKACKLGLMALAKDKTGVHIQILSDNTTTCSYINKFGGKKSELNELARQIWLWCIDKKIHISAAHIPGKFNEEADALSRSYKNDLEWSLCNSILVVYSFCIS